MPKLPTLNLFKKSYSGNVDDIIRCIACNQGCYDRYVLPQYPHISCMRNPAVGREKEYALVMTNVPKKVLVVGGGIAGLEAAVTLKLRGHNPILAEAGSKLGGQFLLAGVAPRKAEMREAAISRGEQAGVDVRLATRFTPDYIEEVKPDEVILATGAAPAKLNITGRTLQVVYDSCEVLSGLVNPKGNVVVVVGGGLVGLEVAEYLPTRQSCHRHRNAGRGRQRYWPRQANHHQRRPVHVGRENHC